MKAIHRNGVPALAAIVMVSTLAYLNLEGSQTQVCSPWPSGRSTWRFHAPDIFTEPPLANWAHGWPCGCLIRHSIYSMKAGKGVKLMSFTGDHGYYSRWPIDNAPVAWFGAVPLLIDGLVGLALVVGVALGVRHVHNRYPLRAQFGLRSLFVATTLAAIASAFGVWRYPARHLLQFSAFGLVAVGLLLSASALWVHVIRRPARQQGNAASRTSSL